MKKGELQGQVEYCLKKYKQTRNSDIELTIQIWKEYYPQRLRESQDGLTYVALPNLFELPREDNVKRIRAKIQNELGQYLPTSLAVARQRRINEQKWRTYMLTYSD